MNQLIVILYIDFDWYGIIQYTPHHLGKEGSVPNELNADNPTPTQSQRNQNLYSYNFSHY